MIKITNMKLDSRFIEQGSRYFHKEAVEDKTSAPVRVPLNARPVVVSVFPGTAATVQYTFDTEEVIEDGLALWLDWPRGEVTEPTMDSAQGAIVALRLVSTGLSNWTVSV